jgi:serine/threonine-protein kinase
MNRLLPARLQAALLGDGSPRAEIPGDVLRESRRRIRFAATLGTLTYALFLAMQVTGLEAASRLETQLDRVHNLLGILLCSVLLAVAALPGLRDRLVLRWALVTEVLLAVLISTLIPWASYERTAHVSGLTWVVPVMILFALLVPLPTRTTLTVSALCALTMPLGLFVLSALGRITVSPAEYWNSGLTASIAVGIATLAARTVYGASKQLATARQVGSYELIEPIGKGGMGQVWKARHLLLARPAAVKLILAENLQGAQEQREQALERFTREARVTASLRSPHTVELYDFGTSSDGSLYYAMELLDGMNVEHFVYRFGAIEPRRAVHWLAQICHSLAEAHARGLIHRDIKPGNIFLSRYGRDADFIKVLDFGLAKPLEPPVNGSLTQTGTRLGTPSYMAPEQVFGLDVAPRTDLYAVGCVGYWLLAGHKPFEAEHAGELMRLHVEAPPPPLSGRAPHAIPAALDALVMKCLSKSAADRPADAESLGAALEASVDGAAWTQDEAREWWERNLSAAAGTSRT